MAEARSDAEMIDRLLERVKLVIAVDEEMPVKLKLEVQPMIRELQGALALSEADQDRGRIAAYHQTVIDMCEEFPNVTALMGAVGNFVSFL